MSPELISSEPIGADLCWRKPQLRPMDVGRTDIPKLVAHFVNRDIGHAMSVGTFRSDLFDLTGYQP
jgi:hypothetical protein